MDRYEFGEDMVEEVMGEWSKYKEQLKVKLL